MWDVRTEVKFYTWASGKSMASVAKELGVSRQHLNSDLARGNISYERVKKIARLCGYRIRWEKVDDQQPDTPDQGNDAVDYGI